VPAMSSPYEAVGRRAIFVIQDLLSLGVGGAFIEQACYLRFRVAGIEKLGEHLAGKRWLAGGAAMCHVKDHRVWNSCQMHRENLPGPNSELADARELHRDIGTFTGAEQFGDGIAVGKRLASLPRNLDQLETGRFGKPSLAQLDQLQNFVLRRIERTQLIGVRERH